MKKARVGEKEGWCQGIKSLDSFNTYVWSLPSPGRGKHRSKQKVLVSCSHSSEGERQFKYTNKKECYVVTVVKDREWECRASSCYKQCGEERPPLGSDNRAGSWGSYRAHPMLVPDRRAFWAKEPAGAWTLSLESPECSRNNMKAVWEE